MTKRDRLRRAVETVWLSLQTATLFALLTLAVFLVQTASRQMGWL